MNIEQLAEVLTKLTKGGLGNLEVVTSEGEVVTEILLFHSTDLDSNLKRDIAVVTSRPRKENK